MGADGRNYYRFRLGPDFELALGARVKRPGPLMAPMPVELSAVKFSASDEMEAYERLLADAMKGDQLLFVRQDAVEAQWAIVEPILGDCCPVQIYEPGTWGPTGCARAGGRYRRLARSGVGTLAELRAGDERVARDHEAQRLVDRLSLMPMRGVTAIRSGR